jgi:hypothetical protein
MKLIMCYLFNKFIYSNVLRKLYDCQPTCNVELKICQVYDLMLLESNRHIDVNHQQSKSSTIYIISTLQQLLSKYCTLRTRTEFDYYIFIFFTCVMPGQHWVIVEFQFVYSCAATLISQLTLLTNFIDVLINYTKIKIHSKII